jgi:hypothetical protein
MLILLTFTLNCKSQKTNCEARVFKLIESFEAEDINKFIGIGIESRGIDLNGERFLRIYYSNKEGYSFRIPSLQPTGDNENPNLVDSVRVKLAHEFNLPDSTSKAYLVDLIKKCKEIYISQNLKKINSQRRLGDFIEFVLDDECSVYYKKENSIIISETYKVYFQEAKEVKKNWFIIKYRNLGPILKEHPINVKIDE